MIKRMGFFSILFLAFISLVACNNNDKKEPEVFAPRFSEISVMESSKTAGAVDIFIKALDEEAVIYYVIVANDSKTPTHTQIKAALAYDGVLVHASGNKINSLNTTVEGLEQNTKYDVYVTLEFKNKFAASYYKTTITTADDDAVIDKGEGTLENPYRIYTINDLEKVGMDDEMINASFQLENDINLAEKYGPDLLSFIPFGYQSGSQKTFNGSFDGKGHTISNLYIKFDKEAAGLFTKIGANGSASNFTLKDVDITSNKQRVGAVCGYNQGTIANVNVIGGTLRSVDTLASNIGGAVGYFYQTGVVTKVFTDVTVIASGENVGGVIGSVDATADIAKPLEVSNCYSLGDVSGEYRYVGGVVGRLRGANMSSCYATGNITGKLAVGGVVGFLQKTSSAAKITPSVKNCFALGNVITVTGDKASQNNASGFVIGNKSTSNGDSQIANLYHCDTQIINMLNSGSNRVDGDLITLDKLSDSLWLKENLDITINNVIWTLKDNAKRPTLVSATMDDGSYEAPNMTTLEVSNATKRNEINVSIKTSLASDIYYIVVLNNSLAPTAKQIMDMESYGEVRVIKSGTLKASNSLNETISLDYSTSYDVYAYAEAANKEGTITKQTIKTNDAPLTSTIEVADGDLVGSIKLIVTTNKVASSYYFITTDFSVTKTLEEIIALNYSFIGEIVINQLMDNVDYKIMIVTKTSDEVTQVMTTSFKTAEDTEKLTADLVIAATSNDLVYKASVTLNKASTINYLVTNNSTFPAKSDLINTIVATANTNFNIIDLAYSTTYYVYLYLQTSTEETEIICKSFTTTEEPALQTSIELRVVSKSEIELKVTANKVAVGIYYIVKLASEAAPSIEEVLTTTPIFGKEHTITDLLADTNYSIYVIVKYNDQHSELLMQDAKTLADNVEVYVPFKGENTKSYFPIYNKADFILISDIFNGTNTDYEITRTGVQIILFADIVFEIGESFNNFTKETFKGTFDGQNYTITNLTLSGETSYFGLFRELDTAGIIKNVHFNNANVVNNYVTTGQSGYGTGTLIGNSKGTVSNVKIYNSRIESKYITDSRLGSLIGRVQDGNVSNCASIACEVIGGKYVGGIIGHADYSKSSTSEVIISNLYIEDITIKASVGTGGAIGYCRVTAKNIVVKSMQLIVPDGATSSQNGAVIGYVQNSSNNALKTSVSSLVYYGKGKLIGTVSGTDLDIRIPSILKVNTSTDANATTVTLADLTQEYILAKTTFDLVNMWNLDAFGYLTLKVEVKN